MSSAREPGNLFEDFRVGETFHHAVPRTITEGDASLYIALYGDRFPLHCSAQFARSLGFRREVVNPLLLFNTVFGKSVPDVSARALANLGYARVRFLRPVYPGDTVRSESRVIGCRESSSGETGVVWVHTTGYSQDDEPVLEFYRWVLIPKRDPSTPTGAADAPELPRSVPVEDLRVPPELDLSRFDPSVTGSDRFFEDYALGQRVHHAAGMTIEEAEHQMATRLFQNTAWVHFDALQTKETRYGRRIIYGGHIISLARAISFDGLENALWMLAWNGATHANPTFAGDTLYAFTDVLERVDLGRDDVGALRLRLVAVKNQDPRREEVAIQVQDEKTGRQVYNPNVVLDLDYLVLMPKRPK